MKLSFEELKTDMMKKQFLDFPMEYIDPNIILLKDRSEINCFFNMDVELTIEVGVFRGDYSKCIIDKLNPKKHICIDVWKHQNENYDDNVNFSDDKHEMNYQDTIHRFKYEIENGKVEIIREFSKIALSQLLPNSADFVFIDANHAFLPALEDIEGAIRILKKGGIVGGHDFGVTWVKHAVLIACKYFKFKMIGYGMQCNSFFLQKDNVN